MAEARVDTFRRNLGRTCACGQPGVALMLYGDSAETAWGGNVWCDEHAGAPQVHPVALVERLVDY